MYLGPQDTHPPPSVVVPDEPALVLPAGITCGEVIKATMDDTFRSPGFPDHLINQECAFVLQASPGYGFQVTFPEFRLDPRFVIGAKKQVR